MRVLSSSSFSHDEDRVSSHPRFNGSRFDGAMKGGRLQQRFWENSDSQCPHFGMCLWVSTFYNQERRGSPLTNFFVILSKDQSTDLEIAPSFFFVTSAHYVRYRFTRCIRNYRTPDIADNLGELSL